MKDGRRDVIRQVPVHTKPAACKLAEFELKDISCHDLDAGPLTALRSYAFAQAFRQSSVCFDRNYTAALASKELSHLAVTCTNIDPHVISRVRKRVEDAPAPTWITEEVLPHALAWHSGAKCINVVLLQQIASRSSMSHLF
jgi:hypothetical protein